jgi:RND family efflux transporter MFP subunit
MKKLTLLMLIFASKALLAQEFIGIIKPIADVELSMPIDGKIAKIAKKEGAKVLKRDTILKLEDTLQKLDTQRREIIYHDRSQLNSALKSEKLLNSLLNSTKKLYERTKAVSRDEVRTLEMKYYSLKGEIEAKQENEKKEKVEYEMAKALLEQYHLKSPIDGVITKIELQEGEWAKAGMAIVQVVNPTICYLDINIEERYLDNIKLGESFSFNVKTRNVDMNKVGKITFVSPIADSASGLVRIKIEFENQDLKITPGLSATIDIDFASKK